MKPQPFVGARVRIAQTDGVCAYLHGAIGTVIGHHFCRTSGKTLADVRLDEPRAPTEHWTPIKQVGLSPEELDLLTSAEDQAVAEDPHA